MQHSSHIAPEACKYLTAGEERLRLTQGRRQVHGLRGSSRKLCIDLVLPFNFDGFLTPHFLLFKNKISKNVTCFPFTELINTGIWVLTFEGVLIVVWPFQHIQALLFDLCFAFQFTLSRRDQGTAGSLSVTRIVLLSFVNISLLFFLLNISLLFTLLPFLVNNWPLFLPFCLQFLFQGVFL